MKAQGIALLRAQVSSLLQERGVTATSVFGGAVAGCAVNIIKYHALPARVIPAQDIRNFLTSPDFSLH